LLSAFLAKEEVASSNLVFRFNSNRKGPSQMGLFLMLILSFLTMTANY